MPASVILIEASPRVVASGAVSTMRMAGGGASAPYYYSGQHWRAGVVQLPTFTTELGFDGGEIGTGGVPQAAEIQWAPSSKADLAAMAALYWPDAAVTIRIGPEGALPPVRLTGKVLDAQVADGVLKLQMADPAAALKKPLLTARYAGTGGLEGPVEWTGKIRRRVWGRVWNLAGEPIDKANNIYAFADPLQKLQAFDALRDKGAAASSITVLAWAGSAAATFAALQAAAAPGGGGVVCPSIACVKWWTKPAGDLTADLRGEIGASYVETAPEIAERLVGVIGGVAFAAGTVAAAKTLRPAAVGWVAKDENTGAAAQIEQLLGDNSLLWVLDAAGAIVLRPWAWGASTASAVSRKVTRKRALKPVATRKIGYQRNETQMARGDLAAIVLREDGANMLEAPLTMSTGSAATAGAFYEDTGASSSARDRYRIRLDDNNAAWFIQDNLIPVSAGETLWMRAYFYAGVGASGTSQFKMQAFNTNGGYVSDIATGPDNPASAGPLWLLREGLATIPAGVAYVKPYFERYGGVSGGSFYLAEPVISRHQLGATQNVDGANMIPDPLNFNGGSLANGAIFQTLNAAGRPAERKCAELAFANNALCRWGPLMACRPGEKLFYQHVVSSNSSTGTETCNASFSYFDASGAPLGAVNLSGSSYNTSRTLASAYGVWAIVSCAVTVPAGAAYIQFYVERPVFTGFSFYVGEPVVTRAQSGADVTASNVSAGITGQGVLATANNVDPSTAVFLSTGSVPPILASGSFTYTSTASSVTLSWAAFTLYRTDGTTIAVSAGSQAITGLSASNTYCVYPYVVDSGGTTGTVSLAAGAIGSPAVLSAAAGSAASQAIAYLRANIPVRGLQVSTPASGSGGGGGGAFANGFGFK